MSARAPLDACAMLFVPASRPKMLAKARTIDVPAVIVDLEDGVGVEEKAAARSNVVELLAEPWPGPSTLFVRVNGPSTPEFVDDLRAVADLGATGIAIPKCESSDDVLRARTNLELGGAPDDIGLLPFVESPRGILNAYAIATASELVVALALGSEDLAASMGIARTKGGDELAYYRSAVAVAAHAAGIIPVDGVFIDFNDEDGLERDAEVGRSLGFGGKQIIHPAQIAPVLRAYAPTSDEIDRAARIVDAFERGGGGVVVVDGQMVDRPIMLQAKRVLARAGRP